MFATPWVVSQYTQTGSAVVYEGRIQILTIWCGETCSQRDDWSLMRHIIQGRKPPHLEHWQFLPRSLPCKCSLPVRKLRQNSLVATPGHFILWAEKDIWRHAPITAGMKANYENQGLGLLLVVNEA